VGWNLRLRTRRSHTSTRNTENTASLYWLGPPESKTLRLVLRFVLLGDCVLSTRVASPTLYWPADEVGSQTLGRLRPEDLSLYYTSCHISSICFGRNRLRSCLVRQVLRSFWIRLSGESSRRSLGGRMGHQLGQLGPLTGQWVF
jgi:hypothetical protein